MNHGFYDGGYDNAVLAIDGQIRLRIEARYATLKPRHWLIAYWLAWRCERRIRRQIERRAPADAFY